MLKGLQSRVYQVRGYNKAGEKVTALVAAIDAYSALEDFGGHKIHRPTACILAKSVHA